MNLLWSDATNALAIVVPILILHLILRKLRAPIMRVMARLVSQTENPWDDVLVERGIVQAIWHLLSSVALQIVFPIVLNHDVLALVLTRFAIVYTTVNVAWIVNIGLWGVMAWYATLSVAQHLPIRVFVQVARILTIAGAILVAVSALTGQSIFGIVGALGASAAVILLISRDSISSLVAGIQIVGSGMVRVGDWIQVGTADGEVIDVTLQSVEIRNWDRSVSHVPMGQLLSGTGFRNFRHQLAQGGMHILKPLYVDISTISQDDSGVTNLTKYRNWVSRKLDEDSRISFVQYVRQLPVDRLGIPIEISAFSVTTDWPKHEQFQADILDDLIADMEKFGLRPSHARADPRWQDEAEAE